MRNAIYSRAFVMVICVLIFKEKEEIKYDMKIVLNFVLLTSLRYVMCISIYLRCWNKTFHRKIIPLDFTLSSKADWPSSLPPISCILLHQTHLESITILIILRLKFRNIYSIFFSLSILIHDIFLIKNI